MTIAAARWVPAAIAMIMALPGFAFTWLWDDFDFIARVLRFRPSFLLPDRSVVFYRPLSRELAFGLMWITGHGSPLPGHLLNAMLLAGVVVLVTSLVAELVSSRAGLIAGVLFAALGVFPLLVGWASGIQDLLAMLFVVASLRLAIRGRSIAAAIALGAAALSKETALVLLPVIAGLPWILNREPKRTWRWVVPFLTIGAAWMASAPGLRVLAERVASGGGSGSASVPGAYIGVGIQGAPASLFQTVVTLLNLPVPGSTGGGLAGRWAIGIGGLVLCAVAWWLSGRLGDAKTPAQNQPSPRRVALLGFLLAALPGLLTAAIVRNWNPYYAAFSMIGVAVLVGVSVDRIPIGVTALLLPLYMLAGLWTRGASPGPTVTCEANFSRTSEAARYVEAGFKRLYPTLPPGTQVLVSVASSGELSIDAFLHRFQALRTWYGDPSIVTRSPETYTTDGGPVALFRVIPTLDVVEIDPERFMFRSSGARPDPTEVSRPARTYVRAIAGQGDPIRAAQFQRRIAQLERGTTHDYDLRLAAMYLLVAGQRGEARGLLDSLPPIPLPTAILNIKKIDEESPPGLHVRSFAFEAFGVSESDLEARRSLMRLLRSDGHVDLAAAVAGDILGRSGTDPEAQAVVREARAYRPPDRITAGQDGARQ